MEHWREIKGYEGLYEVSSYGNVRALERTVTNKNGKPQKYPAKLLKPDVNVRSNTTYLRVTLCKEHQTKRFQVHQLVALAFIPVDPERPFINHIDNNGLNNEVSNLEWCTHSENMLHAQKQGRLFTAQSKGGRKGSRKEVASAIKNSEGMVGNLYHYWFINDHYVKKRPNGKGDYRVLCTCTLCNTQYDRSAKCILRGGTKSCKKCALTVRRRYSLVSHESVSCT
ncbi:MAG: NUMOD4 domain-containing protein [Aeromonas veronii]